MGLDGAVLKEVSWIQTLPHLRPSPEVSWFLCAQSWTLQGAHGYCAVV